MPTEKIQEFARILIEHVRDASIQSSDHLLSAQTNNVVSKRWKAAVQSGDPHSLLNVVIPDVVDDTLFYLLQAIDTGLLKLSFTASNGKVVDLPTDGLGELAGWYMGSGGWRRMFSKERFVDDFVDLG
jgi:hypothetical protein